MFNLRFEGNRLFCALKSRTDDWYEIHGSKESTDINLRCYTALTLNVLVVGSKQKTEGWIQSGIDTFETRLKSIMKVNTVFIKNDQQLIKAWEDAKGVRCSNSIR